MFPLSPVPAKLCLVDKTPHRQNPQGLTMLKPQQNLEGLTNVIANWSVGLCKRKTCECLSWKSKIKNPKSKIRNQNEVYALYNN
jgi:hypothetical protein